MSTKKYPDRRNFLRSGIAVSLVAGTSGLFIACEKDKEEDVSPAEDLMREHGLLNRILLIYDFCIERLKSGEKFPTETLYDSAAIIRNFIEDYHEKLEEDFLFPRFEKANILTDLVAVLRVQHKAGRALTEQVMLISKYQTRTMDDDLKMQKLLRDFNRMYRPHEAREDTVLFPALRKIISKHEYDSLGEDFEKKEHELFGKDGFELMVEKVSGIEKKIGIYELAQFTPVQ